MQRFIVLCAVVAVLASCAPIAQASGAGRAGDAVELQSPPVRTSQVNPRGDAGPMLEILPSDDAMALAAALAGPGVTIHSATLITGEVSAQGHFPISGELSEEGTTFPSGIFQNGPFGMASGVLLTSGEVTLAMPPNVSVEPYNEGATGVHSPSVVADPFCDAVIAETTVVEVESHDVTTLILELSIEDGPDVEGLQIDYVFGSEEYPFYQGGEIEIYDTFGIFIGPFDEPLPPEITPIAPNFVDGAFYYNIGRDQEGFTIGINGVFFSGDTVIETFGPEGNSDLSQYNGLTPRITSSLALPTGPEHVYTLRIVICDAQDQILDSGVFLTELRACLGDCGGTGFCGDGIVQRGEECDDGNNIDDDECSNACRVNPGFEAPEIALQKLLIGGEPYTTVGDVLDFGFLIRNTGNVILADVVVDDPAAGAPLCEPAQPAELFPNEEMSCSVSYTVRPEDMATGSFINVAFASGLARESMLAEAEDSEVAIGGCEFVGCMIFRDSFEQ